MKNIDVAVKQHLDNYMNGEFKGGEVFTLGINDNGVGLPQENPNLSEDTMAKVSEVVEQIKNGEVVVPSTLDDLNTFLTDYNYHVDGVNY